MTPNILHVANGDSTAGTLRDARLPGRVVNWADALTDGPVPNVDPAEFRRVRGGFWSERGFGAADDLAGAHERWDRDLLSFADGDEVVIWCEHDLYDQLLLLHHLHVFEQRRPTKLSIVSVDRFPGVARFIGLGQLAAEQLASLFPTRQSITSEQLALGSDGWYAFTSDDPTAIERFARRDLAILPFMARALAGLLVEFPGTRDGLPHTERRLLDLLAGGARTFGALFVAWQASEAIPCYGDSSIWWRLGDLAAGTQPLVTISDASRRPQARATIAITDTGRRVLAGDMDWLAIDPFDRWIGGARVTNARAWRWDAERRGLVRPPG